MATTNQVCKNILEQVGDCLAVGVVDLDTGMLMGVHHSVPYFTQEYLEAVAAAAVDMFRGASVRRVEEMIRQHYGDGMKDSFEEIFISSPRTNHFMASIKDKGAVVVMVTQKSVNQAIGWITIRNSLSMIEATLP